MGTLTLILNLPSPPSWVWARWAIAVMVVCLSQCILQDQALAKSVQSAIAPRLKKLL
ncbi:MAG TPA: hypothetical protein V6D33_14250 [Cyanophyceae cyanobacterium]